MCVKKEYIKKLISEIGKNSVDNRSIINKDQVVVIGHYLQLIANQDKLEVNVNDENLENEDFDL